MVETHSRAVRWAWKAVAGLAIGTSVLTQTAIFGGAYRLGEQVLARRAPVGMAEAPAPEVPAPEAPARREAPKIAAKAELPTLPGLRAELMGRDRQGVRRLLGGPADVTPVQGGGQYWAYHGVCRDRADVYVWLDESGTVVEVN